MLIPLPTRVRELESLEGIQREELRWEEERFRCAARITFFKKCKAIHKQLGAATRKQEVAAQRAHRTLIRRIDTLVIEEQRGRLSLMQNESLRLENILRILEGGIREAVFSADYDLQQRIKYFNKTVEMITRDESRERKATVGTERYEWLVMCQRFDSGTLRLQRAEVIAKVSAEKAARHDKTREAHQRRARTLADSRPADNRSPQKLRNQSTASMEDIPDGRDEYSTTRSEKSKKTASNDVAAKMRVRNRHGTEYWDRMLSCAEDQELSKRRAIFIDEDRAWYGLCRFADFIKEREARYTRTDINEIELAKVRARRLQVTQKQEQQERDEIGHLEAVAFQGFQRRLLRILHENDRFTETEQRRQMGHDQRLAHRYARIALQQIAFVERERMAITDLLSVTKEETPAVVRHIIPDPVEVSAELSRERRKLFKREEKERNQLVQEENTCFHILYAEMMSSGGASGCIRDSKREAARIRREDGEREEQERILKRLEGTLNKSEIAHRKALCKIEAERLGRAEQQARVRINQELVDWQGLMVAHYKTASRMCALLPGVQSEEDRLRGVLLSQERNLRESYAQAFKVGLRPKTKAPPPPLPSPPADYEQAKKMYAEYKKMNQHGSSKRRHQELTPMASASSVNAYPMMSSTMVSSVSSRNGGRLSPRKPLTLSPLSSSSLSLSRSGMKGVAGTPHKPPPRVIEGYLGMLNSPSKVAPRAKRYQGTAIPIATAQKRNTCNDDTTAATCATEETTEGKAVASANVDADQKCEVQAPQSVTPPTLQEKEEETVADQNDGNHSSYSDDGFDQEAKSSKTSTRSSSSHHGDSIEKKSSAKKHSSKASTPSRNSRRSSSDADRMSVDGKQEPDSPRSSSPSRGSASRRSSENISDKQKEDDHKVSRPSSAENKKEEPATPSDRRSHSYASRRSSDSGASSDRDSYAARADQQEIEEAKNTTEGFEEEL